MHATDAAFNKVANVTFAFWVIKIAATTLGETGGDALSMSLNFGYALSTVIFFTLFLITLIAQIHARTYHRYLYWSVIVTTTTAGTTLADFADRSVGLGYIGGSVILFALLLAVLAIWKISMGSVAVDNITQKKTEVFYWMTIFTSNTLGTALGDYFADGSGFGYGGSAMIFGTSILVLALIYFYTKTSRTLLFWSAFILTRPLGATLGDLLTKPLDHGGLNLSRFSSSFVLFMFMVVAITLTHHVGKHLRKRIS